MKQTFLNSKNLFTITRTFIARNIDAGQNFPENKKRPRPSDASRTICSFSPVWQSRSPGYFVLSSVWVCARLLPLVFSHSQKNTFLRDMKPPSACLCFYFTTSPAVFQPTLPWINPNKTATHVDSSAHFVTSTETNRTFCYPSGIFLYLSALRWWESGCVCQRRAAIL